MWKDLTLHLSKFCLSPQWFNKTKLFITRATYFNTKLLNKKCTLLCPFCLKRIKWQLNKGPFESKHNCLLLLSLFRLTTCFGPHTGPPSFSLNFRFMYPLVDNIRMDLQEVGCGYMDWIGLAQDRDRWWKLVSAVMNLRVPWNAGNFLTSCKPVSFSRRTLHHGVSKYERMKVYHLF